MRLLKADVVITDGDIDLMMKSLEDKKVVLAAIEMGPFAKESKEKKWSDHFQAHVLEKEETTEGVCFCQKPATHLVYFWR